VDDKKFKKLQQENSDMQQQLFEYKKTIDSMVSQANELKFTLRRYKDISDKSAKEIKALQDIIDEIDPNRKERLFQIAITEEVPEWDGSKDKED
jgi:peptidoglycan hydrolase CwlO-like protein